MERTSFGSDIVPLHIPDKDGCTMRLSKIVKTGFILPYFPDCFDAMKKFRAVEARSDDVLVCGYPKCGTHWVWEVTGMLLESNSTYIQNIKENVMLEAMELDDLSSIRSPRVLNSHLPLLLLPPDFSKIQCKLIFLLRHPKDVAVSLYNHVINLNPMYKYDGTWAGFLDLFQRGLVEYGSYFEYIRGWENAMTTNPEFQIHIIHFEDMKQRPVVEITRLAEFLGANQDSELFYEIAKKTSFTRMKEAKGALDDEKEKAGWTDGRPMMYRKGEMNDWKNWFTVAQSDQFDAIFVREMAGSMITFPTYNPIIQNTV